MSLKILLFKLKKDAYHLFYSLFLFNFNLISTFFIILENSIFSILSFNSSVSKKNLIINIRININNILDNIIKFIGESKYDP